jgi:hypothetical protein
MILAQTTSHYERRGVNSRRSYFTQTFEVLPGDIRIIRIVHHRVPDDRVADANC